MELLDGLANEQVPAAKAAIEQRRQARAPAAAVDGGDAGDEPSVGSSDSEDDGNDDQGIEGDEREEMRLVEEEDALEDGPADDLLDGLDDMPVEVRERIQGELEPSSRTGCTRAHASCDRRSTCRGLLSVSCVCSSRT